MDRNDNPLRVDFYIYSADRFDRWRHEYERHETYRRESTRRPKRASEKAPPPVPHRTR